MENQYFQNTRLSRLQNTHSSYWTETHFFNSKHILYVSIIKLGYLKTWYGLLAFSFTKAVHSRISS